MSRYDFACICVCIDGHGCDDTTIRLSIDYFFAHAYSKWLNSSIWTIDGTLNTSQSEPGSNGNDGVFHNPQSSKTGALL